MRQASLFKASDVEVKRGQIYRLGRHRLMCGDATSKDDVATLFGQDKPTLVVTSPPYADARNYNDPIECWDSMMLSAFDGPKFSDNVQLLINLGPIHRKGEWVPYWTEWLQSMRRNKWRIFAQYIWDKTKPAFGENQGRCRSMHEFIFHINKSSMPLNLTIKNKTAGAKSAGYNTREKNGEHRRICTPGSILPMRTQDSIFRVSPAEYNGSGHPAVYPRAFAAMLISSWKKSRCIVYDPFCGSGTTLLSCEQENVLGLGMEISPAYVEMAIKRWQQLHPKQSVSLA
jgi:DNA modification methylase